MTVVLVMTVTVVVMRGDKCAGGAGGSDGSCCLLLFQPSLLFSALLFIQPLSYPVSPIPAMFWGPPAFLL